jgi:hypothetical protein
METIGLPGLMSRGLFLIKKEYYAGKAPNEGTAAPVAYSDLGLTLLLLC